VNLSVPTAPIETTDETVDQLIARVLRQAHRTTAPDEARAVLHVAHSFADELATLDPRFDRLQFIQDVTEDPS
jgi:hypothetical protein